MKLFVHPHEGKSAEVESWNIVNDEPEQIMVTRNGRAYCLLFGETPTLEIWSLDSNENLGEVLQEIKIPVIREQLEFDFVKNL